MADAQHPLRRRAQSVGVLCAVLAAVALPCAAGAAAPSSQLKPPRTTVAQDQRYFTDVTLADPALATYTQQQGDLALRALLTDGAAFCALLKRGGGIDRALLEEAEGARSTESTTHLPLSVATFNTIEAVSLLTLCPSEQKLVPRSVRTKIRRLGDALATQFPRNSG